MTGPHVEIQWCPMKRRPDGDTLAARSEAPDYWDIEVREYTGDGSVTILDEYEDIPTIELATIIFDSMTAKYPDASSEFVEGNEP